MPPAAANSNFNLRVPYDAGAETNTGDHGTGGNHSFGGGKGGPGGKPGDDGGFGRGGDQNEMMKKLQDQLAKLCHTLQIKEA